MIRTQVYLPDDKYKELQLMVAVGNKSFSELIREGVDEVIKKKKNVGDVNKSDPWKNFIGVCNTNFESKSGQELIDDYYQKDII